MPTINLNNLEESKEISKHSFESEVESYNGFVMHKMRSDVGSVASAYVRNQSQNDLNMSAMYSERSHSVFISNINLLGRQIGKFKDKKTLFLSLDETLVHCKFESCPKADFEFILRDGRI